MTETTASVYAIGDGNFPVELYHEARRVAKKELNMDEKRHGATKDVEMFGQKVRCVRGVRLLIGPVIGAVTSTTAIVLVEVDACTTVQLHLVPESGEPILIEKDFYSRMPQTFYVTGLQPDTKYNLAIGYVLPGIGTDLDGN